MTSAFIIKELRGARALRLFCGRSAFPPPVSQPRGPRNRGPFSWVDHKSEKGGTSIEGTGNRGQGTAELRISRMGNSRKINLEIRKAETSVAKAMEVKTGEGEGDFNIRHSTFNIQMGLFE